MNRKATFRPSWVSRPDERSRRTGTPGSDPKLHKHLYEEVFVGQDGGATSTAGEEVIEASAGQVVVVPAGVPHKVRALWRRSAPPNRRPRERTVSYRMDRRPIRPPVMLRVRTRHPRDLCRRGHVRRDGGHTR